MECAPLASEAAEPSQPTNGQAKGPSTPPSPLNGIAQPALAEPPPPPQRAFGETDTAALEAPAPRRVQFVQTHLHLLGYYAGPQHGALDSDTREAIKRFQHKVGMGVDGRITMELYEELQSEYKLCVVTKSLAVDPSSIERVCKSHSANR